MKKFRDLLLAGIDEDIHGTTIERLIKVKQTFESEMVYKGIKPSTELLTYWLQGLCWAVHVPYMNEDIIEWYKSTRKRQPKNELLHDATGWQEKLLENYWPQLGKTLYEMLYN